MALSRRHKFASFQSNFVYCTKALFTKTCSSVLGRKKKKPNPTQYIVVSIVTNHNWRNTHVLVKVINTLFYIHFSSRKHSSVEYWNTPLPPWFLTLPLSDRATYTKIILSYLTLQTVCGLTADQYLEQNVQIVWRSKGEANSCLQQQFPLFKG